MGTEPLTYEEAARILDPETNLEALRAYAGDCEARQAAIVEACRMGAIALRAMPSSEPLTAEQLRERRGKWVWVISLDEHMTVEAWAYVGESQVFTYWEYQQDQIVGRVVYNMCDYGAWLAYDCVELEKVLKALQAAESKLDEAKRYDWISVEERLPIEHDSIFKKLIDDEKWRAGMFKTLSDDVIVAAKFADGTRKTGVTHTKDGIWTGLPSIGCPIVTHWMPMPKPPEQEE